MIIRKSVLSEKGGLQDYILRRDADKLEHAQHFFIQEQACQVDECLAIQALSGITVDVIHEKGHVILGQIIETCPRRQNITDQFMAFLDTAFLPGAVGVTVEYPGLDLAIFIAFQSQRIGKFCPSIRQDDAKCLSEESDAQTVAQVIEPPDDAVLGLIRQEKGSQYRTAAKEEGEQDLPAGSSNHCVHFNDIDVGMLVYVLLEAGIRPADCKAIMVAAAVRMLVSGLVTHLPRHVCSLGREVVLLHIVIQSTLTAGQGGFLVHIDSPHGLPVQESWRNDIIDLSHVRRSQRDPVP